MSNPGRIGDGVVKMRQLMGSKRQPGARYLLLPALLSTTCSTWKLFSFTSRCNIFPTSHTLYASLEKKNREDRGRDWRLICSFVLSQICQFIMHIISLFCIRVYNVGTYWNINVHTMCVTQTHISGGNLLKNSSWASTSEYKQLPVDSDYWLWPRVLADY